MTYRAIIALLILTAIAAMPIRVTEAQEASPTAVVRAARPTINPELDELKARLATKVAELRTVVKRAVNGVVKTVSLTSASIETKTKDIKIELTDDVTVAQIVGGKRVSLSLSDIDESDPVTVFGSYDETLDLLKAQHIFIESSTKTQRVSGVVVDTDSEDFVIMVRTSEGRTVTIDFEKATKTIVWTKDGGLVKGGFSKIQDGDTIHVVGKPDTKDQSRISALRILDIGNVTGAQVTAVPTLTTTITATPSASVTPTRRPTLRPTSSPTP